VVIVIVPKSAFFELSPLIMGLIITGVEFSSVIASVERVTDSGVVGVGLILRAKETADMPEFSFPAISANISDIITGVDPCVEISEFI
jgi:hypothetical protein